MLPLRHSSLFSSVSRSEELRLIMKQLSSLSDRLDVLEDMLADISNRIASSRSRNSGYVANPSHGPKTTVRRPDGSIEGSREGSRSK